jgi:hypothetical protein
VVGKAAQALGKIGADRAIEPLIAVFARNPGRDARARLVDGLSRFGNPTVAQFIQEQQDRSREEERSEKLRQRSPKAYCGLTVEDQQNIRYSGPLMKMKGDSSGMVEIIRRLVRERESGHLVIVLSMALLIVIAPDGSYKGLHFQSAISAEELGNLTNEIVAFRSIHVERSEVFEATELVW